WLGSDADQADDVGHRRVEDVQQLVWPDIAAHCHAARVHVTADVRMLGVLSAWRRSVAQLQRCLQRGQCLWRVELRLEARAQHIFAIAASDRQEAGRSRVAGSATDGIAKHARRSSLYV